MLKTRYEEMDNYKLWFWGKWSRESIQIGRQEGLSEDMPSKVRAEKVREIMSKVFETRKKGVLEELT